MTGLPVPPIARLLLLPALCCFLLASCIGGSGSSPDPVVGQIHEQDVLLYGTPEREGSPARLYKLNRAGASVPFSDLPAGDSVQGFLVSPDKKQVAYWDWAVEGRITLVVRAVDTSDSAQTRLVLDQDQNFDWVEWLPDSRQLLFVLREPGVGTPSLWLLTAGEENPVFLIGADPGTSTRLDYTVSPDGSRAAVVLDDGYGRYPEPPTSAALYLLDLRSVGEPRLIDTASGDANAFDFSWSPTGNALLYQRRLDDPFGQGIARGPVVLLTEDGGSRLLLEENTDRSARWLDAGRILAVAPLAFEVIGVDGQVLASHISTITSAGTDTGGASIVASPDGRWLSFLDWTETDLLEVYLYDFHSGETRVIGPASSVPVVFHGGVIAYYDESEMHWSTDSSWLVWDRAELTVYEPQLYAYAIATGATRLIAANAGFFHGGDGPGLTDAGYPWLPVGNVLEYGASPAGIVGADPILKAEDLDAERMLFIEPFPLGEMTVKDANSGKPALVEPYGICARAWLQNDQLLWHGCDNNAYLSRIVAGSLAETRLLARGVGPFFALTGNRQLVVMRPADYIGNWQMYDLLADRLVEMQGTDGMSCCEGGMLQ